MYISTRNNFAFIHINKTGGRSLTKYFSTHLGLDFYCLGLEFVHKPISQVGKLAGNRRIISIVRNPYDRYESLYSYRRMKWECGNRARQNEEAYNLSFQGWFYAMLESDKILDGTQTSFLQPFPNNLHIVRMEYMLKDVSDFMGWDWRTAPAMPHINKSNRQNVRWTTGMALDLWDLERPIFTNYYREVPRP